MCLRGASEIQSEVLEQIRDPDVHVYAVYLPILRGDREESVPTAITRLPDSRASYFWDGSGEMAHAYSRVLRLPAGRPAWDVYLLFGREADWKSEPPVPNYWMHQLGGLSSERRLDGRQFADETSRLLQMNKK